MFVVRTAQLVAWFVLVLGAIVALGTLVLNLPTSDVNTAGVRLLSAVVSALGVGLGSVVLWSVLMLLASIAESLHRASGRSN